jgi:histidinol-phosphate phosphatase family protein
MAKPRIRPVVFLDRDGTLIHDRPGRYLCRPDQLKFYKTTFEALRLLKSAGFTLVVVTNQSGLGRGFLNEKTLSVIHAKMRRMLKAKKADIDAIYYCPHHPKDKCACRKPLPRLAKRAVRELGLSLNGAVVIGDKKADVDLGKALGIKSVFLKTGHGRLQREKFGSKVRPSGHARNILDAARWVLKNMRKGDLD